ncbi:uncharacterized protein EKO05_0002700 [Ascochyta rabiei]|uniref:uncharacterized protein n=1 Tax=Didymella rabiei TaxID=5454 RepID=UPI0022035C52|nr:uncharacterized protein EKO05_0002700 [Ascochyta rabiei]UPX12133.1 hypothetical protein EKO05_0002700 [Ascochyta rabiei]
MAPARDDEFLPEVWTLYSIGVLWIVLRFAVRLRTDGIRGLRLDDGLAIVALFAWTYSCGVIQITYYTGTNTDFTAAETALFDRAKLNEVAYGSKLFLGTWYAYLVLIFCLKGIVVMLYQRIFFQEWQIWVLRVTIVLCVSGFCGLTLALSLVCLPYRQRWQIVPPPSVRCTASPNILIASSCVNAVTDVFLLSVPTSLLWNLNKPLRTRLAVFILLASGLFVLAACITRVSLTIVQDIISLNIARWGVREFCIAIVAVNTASLRPLFRRSFWTRSRAPAPVQQEHARYNFASVRRARQRLGRSQNRNQVLNSKSPGVSTVDGYIERELGGEEFVFADPDHQVHATAGPPCSAAGGAAGRLDLEKGGAFSRKIDRTDGGFPRVEGGCDGGESAGCSESRSARSS